MAGLSISIRTGNFSQKYSRTVFSILTGASADGVSTGGTSSAFGPKFDGQYYFQYDPTILGQSKERQLWRPYEDNIKGFWETGVTSSNNVSIENSSEKTSYRASLTYLDNKWMMPEYRFQPF